MGLSRRLKRSSDKDKTKPPKLRFVPGFSSLGPTIYLQDRQQETSCAGIPHRPTIPVQTTSSSSHIPQSQGKGGGTPPPDLIIITSWTGAIPKHIAKYTQSYNQLFPSTPILVITTSIADLAVHSTRSKIKVLAPAVQYLTANSPTNSSNPLNPQRTTFSPPPKTPKFTSILLHAFSEGGANKAVCLAQAFLSSTAHRLPVGAFVFDSTPGTPRYSSNVAAFRRSLPPNRLAQAVGLPLGASVLAVTWVFFSIVVGYDNNLISKTRRALNDSALWEVGRKVPRTYLFSESDDLIWWKDVEEHGVSSAETCGARSLLVRFKSTGHCGHARGNEAVYWGAVRRTWETRGEDGAEGRGGRLVENLRAMGTGSTGDDGSDEEVVLSEKGFGKKIVKGKRMIGGGGGEAPEGMNEKGGHYCNGSGSGRKGKELDASQDGGAGSSAKSSAATGKVEVVEVVGGVSL